MKLPSVFQPHESLKMRTPRPDDSKTQGIVDYSGFLNYNRTFCFLVFDFHSGDE